jgi:hypothetical protein
MEFVKNPEGGTKSSGVQETVSGHLWGEWQGREPSKVGEQGSKQ